MNILVTGGAGFIGSRMAARHLSDGHRVAVVDDLSAGRRSTEYRRKFEPMNPAPPVTRMFMLRSGRAPAFRIGSHL